MGFACSTRMATCRRPPTRSGWQPAARSADTLIQRERHELARMPRPADRDDDVLFSLPEVRNRHTRCRAVEFGFPHHSPGLLVESAKLLAAGTWWRLPESLAHEHQTLGD